MTPPWVAEMVFNSFHFAVFFAIVFPLVMILRKRVAARNWLLLAASYYFYGCWDIRFLSLIAISTVVDYFCGLGLNTTEQQVQSGESPARTKKRRLLMSVSLMTNLGILGFFKYYNFFVDSTVGLLNSFGLQADLATLNIILPVGISFYTFQTLSYTIDVYRGKLATERDFLVFGTYVALFPQLVAGPIERASNLLPQLKSATEVTWERIYTGTYLIGWGLFKKVVIADNMARVVDPAFALDTPNGITALVGIYAFAVQIYCDFSGYTDVARGTARMMGFDFMLNFKQPYFSLNPSEFWRRWHISLSSWLRDYLYIPLGGNRKGEVRTYVNLMTTMVLGGLWHGAAWTFIWWGVFHGAMLSLHRALSPALKKLGDQFGRAQWLWFAIRLFVFFHLTCIGWLLFRAESMSQVISMLGAIATDFGTSLSAIPNTNLVGFLAAAALLAGIQVLQYRSDDELVLLKTPVPVRSLAYAGLMLAFMFYGEWGGPAFIYFQF